MKETIIAARRDEFMQISCLCIVNLGQKVHVLAKLDALTKAYAAYLEDASEVFAAVIVGIA